MSMPFFAQYAGQLCGGHRASVRGHSQAAVGAAHLHKQLPGRQLCSCDGTVCESDLTEGRDGLRLEEQRDAVLVDHRNPDNVGFFCLAFCARVLNLAAHLLRNRTNMHVTVSERPTLSILTVAPFKSRENLSGVTCLLCSSILLKAGGGVSAEGPPLFSYLYKREPSRTVRTNHKQRRPVALF